MPHDLAQNEPAYGHRFVGDFLALSRLDRRRRSLAWMAAISGYPDGDATTIRRAPPVIAVRTALIERRASMRSFERLSSRILVVVCTTMAIAMTAFICVTTHLLG